MTSLQILDITQDIRSSCYSILTKMSIGDYLSLIKTSFDNKGNLKGQRETIPTATARKIRKRLEEDLEQVAIIPPVVIGFIAQDTDYKQFKNYENNNIETLQEVKTLLKKLIKSPEELSIIDGMQRTTVLQNLELKKPNLKIRVEFWIAKQVQSLTYRMLVLNTGQTPCTLRRQVGVVFNPLIKEIKQQLVNKNVIINEVGNIEQRRDNGGIYNADKVIEMYIAFALRRPDTDFKDELAEEFSKITMIESLSKPEFLNNFIEIFSIMVAIDIELSKKEGEGEDKFVNGKDLFASHPACIGFMVAAARKIYAYPAQERSKDAQEESLSFIRKQSEILLKKISKYDFDLGFDDLNRNIKSLGNARVGDKQREFFSNSFGRMFKEDFPIDNSLTPFWV